MFVLMDIEWIENRYHHFNPTQIAAMRVDEQWTFREKFYSRIYPRDNSFHNWRHIAYTGGTPSDFLYANGIYHVLTELQSWLREDDVVCFWYADSGNVLRSIYSLVLKSSIAQRIVVLSDYLFPFLDEHGMKRGNAYMLCNKYGSQAVGPKHHSGNDVAAMRKALEHIQYPASLLYGEPPCDKPASGNADKADKAYEARSTHDATKPYQLDENTGIFHKTACSDIPDNAELTSYPDLKYFLRKKCGSVRIA